VIHIHTHLAKSGEKEALAPDWTDKKTKLFLNQKNEINSKNSLTEW
jgi:hypothetical protein